MRRLWTALELLSALPVVLAKTAGELCSGTAVESGGNWYCSAVTSITYVNVSQSGTYNLTSIMDSSAGLCSHQPVTFSGSGAPTPFYDELSIQLRGPLNMSQMAVYNLAPMAQDEVVAVKTITTTVFITSSECLDSSLPSSTSTAPTMVSVAVAGWSRVAYYTSTTPAQATGFTFLANLGNDAFSGTWDTTFGNSLSYVNGNGTQVMANSTPFEGNLATTEYEITVASDRICDGDCGYVRPKSVAYHGWTGESKVFVFEFQMDHHDNINAPGSDYADVPAVWFLNAAIPRILQYGNDRNNIPCSCWATGCGEFDAFELLSRGEERAKSTIHRPGGIEGGDSNYFQRPVGKTIKFAVAFYNSNITAAILDDSFVIGPTLTWDQLNTMVAYDANSNVQSLYNIGG